MARKPEGKLKRGWTTGACATAATKAAYTALVTNQFPDPVTITLPKGEQPAFALCREEKDDCSAMAAIIKDAGDDPDVTHLATIISRVRHGVPGSGIVFHAGEGVGMVTKPGLPIPAGEPAINPVPRKMMTEVITEIAHAHNLPGDVEIEISIPDGKELARKTWNPRLGILNGLSILGTTGVVIPFSCSSWIHSIHRGIDVARATNRPHVAGCTGSTSEKAVMDLYGLEDTDMLDMGDFAGGMLKYLRDHPVPKLTIGGGFGKLTKLAMGHMDLHSGRSQVDMTWLADKLREISAPEDIVEEAKTANTANQILVRCLAEGIPLAEKISLLAQAEALKILTGNARKNNTEVEIIIIDRPGAIVAKTGFSK
ncbi:cobalt-precorrin-5B (C(1))-methyltransferase [Kiloniella majae]|uniref:cobalt-precorrin-5B (C(1))-methyltransferase n=1 Tax=Kiloniella majae TaxID=1938558 RepID=UPI000A277DC3|nr:cobalt-precorrin-5B (C(1))-methyltransferase [Kiloniella majae]